MSTNDKDPEQKTPLQLSRRSTLLGMALGATTLAASSLVRAAASDSNKTSQQKGAYYIRK